MRGVNELCNSTRNGQTIGITNGSTLVSNQLAGVRGADYNIEEFSYLGRVVADTRILIFSTQSKYKSFGDLWNAEENVKIGATEALGDVDTRNSRPLT